MRFESNSALEPAPNPKGSTGVFLKGAKERTKIVASSITPNRLFVLANLTASLILVHLRSSSTRFAGTILPSGLDLDSPQYDAKKTEKLGCFQLSAVQTTGLNDEKTIRRWCLSSPF